MNNRSDASFESLASEFNEEFPQRAPAYRQAQRQKFLEILQAVPQDDGTYDSTKEDQQKRILDLADKFDKEKCFVFNRFTRVAVLCLLHYQHELMKLDELVTQNNVVFDIVKLRETLLLLLEYCE